MTEWKDDDEFTTTYGTLKRSMAEAAEAERERIIALLYKFDRENGLGQHRENPSSDCGICIAIGLIYE